MGKLFSIILVDHPFPNKDTFQKHKTQNKVGKVGNCGSVTKLCETTVWVKIPADLANEAAIQSLELFSLSVFSLKYWRYF